ncbi:hypothetical protein ACQFN5_27955 [Klebsiella sp. WOUb02]|uniref:hypothetical protein n=1 Tax=Klebsiella sp. WOUb02 TaxID=3161071 RepID=UPI003CE8E908
MTISVSKSIERHTTYMGFGAPYASNVDVVLSIDVISAEVIDSANNIANAVHTIKFDIDSGVYLERVEQFNFEDEDDLVSEAEAFLTKFYGE